MNTDLVPDPIVELARSVPTPASIGLPSLDEITDLVPTRLRWPRVARALPWTSSPSSNRSRLLLIAAVIGVIAGVVWLTRRGTDQAPRRDDARDHAGSARWDTTVHPTADVA